MSGELFGNPAASFPSNAKLSQQTANAIPNITFSSGGQVNTWDQGGKLMRQYTAGPAEKALLDSALRSALNFGSSGDATENAVFQRAMTLLQPQLDAEDVSLSNRGIPIGSEIWRKSQDQRGRVLGDTALGAVMAGNQERSRMLGEIMGILTGTPQMSMAPGPMYDPLAPAMARMSGQSQQSGLIGDFVGGLFGLGGSLGGAGILAGSPAMAAGSDRRMKTDIKAVGQTYDGLTVYTFRYRDDPSGMHHMGVMAQDVLQVKPEAVAVRDDGMLGVFYGKL